MRQRLSTRGRDFLIREEGVRRYAYNDSEGFATFGVGHLIAKRPVNDRDRRKWGTPQNPKPMSLVYRVLDEDLVKFEEVVRESVGRQMWQNRFDACVSLAFNIGVGGFENSTVARELRRKRPGFSQRAADAFLLWRRPPVLLPRRRRERHLFLTGDYDLRRNMIAHPPPKAESEEDA